MSEFTLIDDAVAVVDEPQVRPGHRRREKTDATSKTKRQPPYAVVVENDEFHTWNYVIEVLQRVCGHNKSKAFLLTAQIHFTGRASVWTGALEVAELKRDQIRGYGPDDYAPRPVKFPLGVTVEPLPGE